MEEDHQKIINIIQKEIICDSDDECDDLPLNELFKRKNLTIPEKTNKRKNNESTDEQTISKSPRIEDNLTNDSTDSKYSSYFSAYKEHFWMKFGSKKLENNKYSVVLTITYIPKKHYLKATKEMEKIKKCYVTN